jgi:hypothetical protein
LRCFAPAKAFAVLALLLELGIAAGSPAAAQEDSPGSAGDLTVAVNKSDVSTNTGDVFTFTSEITNEGSKSTPGLIANLAFVAVDGETYVDPEDWSPQRTLSLPPIAARSSSTQTWTVKTVLNGDVAVYVAVLPAPPALGGGESLAVSPAIEVHVEEHRALNPGGVLPTVLGVPALLALAFAGLRVVRRFSQ